jgi:uncharacterized protein (TIGR02597 family)
MKTSLSLLTGVASLAALLSGATAQTATTDPVGYITVNVAGGGTLSAPRYTAISPSLVNKVDFAGAATAVDNGAHTMTFAGTPFTAAAFAAGYYVEVTTAGANEGAWRNITGNTTSAITLATDFPAAVTTGATVKIRKHVTISDFFGTTNTAGLGGGEDGATADEVVFLDPNQSLRNYFYSNTPGFTGWFNLSFVDANNVPVPPNQGLLVLRKQATPVSFVRVGHVKTGKTQLGFVNNFNVVPVPLATGTTLGNSNLYTGSLATGVDGGEDGAGADEVIKLGADGVLTNYFYSDTPGFTGWFNLAFVDANNVSLAEGTAVLLQRKGGGAFTWSAPAQTIAP